MHGVIFIYKVFKYSFHTLNVMNINLHNTFPISGKKIFWYLGNIYPCWLQVQNHGNKQIYTLELKALQWVQWWWVVLKEARTMSRPSEGGESWPGRCHVLVREESQSSQSSLKEWFQWIQVTISIIIMLPCTTIAYFLRSPRMLYWLIDLFYIKLTT